MPAKDFGGAMRQRRIGVKAEDNTDELSVVGPSPLVAELEKAAAQLPVAEIPLDRLQDNPYQALSRPQTDPQALAELADSIRSNGFYGALLARRKKGTAAGYELSYGHRRRDAARLAGLSTLPVKVVELSDQEMARIMASENFSRQDLTPLGEANVVGLLSSSQNLTANEIASVIGKSPRWVNLRLSLYEAPADLKEMVQQRPDTITHVQILSQVAGPEQRAPLIRAVLENRLNRSQVQNQVEIIKKTGGKRAGGERIVKNLTEITPRNSGEIPHKVETGLTWQEYLLRLEAALDGLEAELEKAKPAAIRREKARFEKALERLKKLAGN